MIIASLFWKLKARVSTNNLKADIKGTSGRLKMCKNIFNCINPSYQLSRNFMPCFTRGIMGLLICKEPMKQTKKTCISALAADFY